MSDVISLFLVPDASAGRSMRRVIAEQKRGLGTKVVTWPELVEEVRLAYLLPEREQTWADTIREAMVQFDGGYWNDSFAVDPEGTSSAVAAALEEFIRAGAPVGGWVDPALSPRTAMVLSDLHDLWARTERALPPELTLFDQVRNSPDRATQHFSVHHVENWPSLDKFQSDFITLLNDRGRAPDDGILTLLQNRAALPTALPGGSGPGDLAALCFSGQKDALSVGDEITFLLARDPLQEIEAAAVHIRRRLDEGLEPRDIGVLAPDDAYYHHTLAGVFTEAGLLTAGLPARTLLRDLGGEVVRSLVFLSRGPVPKMALAALFTSPIAPWSTDTGLRLAADIMAGRFELKSPFGISSAEEEALVIVRRLRDGTASITDAIRVFIALLEDEIHLVRLHALAGLVDQHTTGGEPVDHDALLRLIGHDAPTIETSARFPANGIPVFQEGQESWTEVEHLIVLGFNAGRYPALPGATPVLHDIEKAEVRDRLDWALQTSDIVVAIRRQRFQRQIAAATGSVTFLASARDIAGKPRQPAEAATFMAGILGRDLDHLFVPIAESTLADRTVDLTPTAPRQPAPADLKLKRDILTHRSDADGNSRPESPTSLETLLVSPLAWLLRTIGAEPRPWETDGLDARLQGNISHSVFEHLFPVGGNGIDRTTIEADVDEALASAIRQHAPLLTTAQWKVERQTLRGTLIQAVAWWQDVLDALGGRVVGAEARLTGEFNGLPIRGFCDQIIQLPGGELVVVDFKKSSGGKRRERMELGYDCQLSLYEIMLGDDGAGLSLEVVSGRPGIVYFTLNDQRVLTDDKSGLPSDLPGLAVVNNDVSGFALRDIKARLKQLRLGIIEMNRDDDATRLDKEKGLPGFALELSPLVTMFAHPTETEDVS